MSYRKVSKPKAFKLRGGAVTALPKALLSPGAYSMIQNLRNEYPGFSKRLGQRKLHTTADGTNQVLSLYQFKKNRTPENRLFAQMGDADVLEATNNPPTVTTGVFGSEVFSGASGQVPASWSVINDLLLYSNGTDQHQIYGGDTTYIDSCNVYSSATTMPAVPEIGEDYSQEARDGNSSTVVVLDALGTNAGDALLIKTPVPVKSLTFTVPAVNGNASVATVNYFNGAWVAVSGLSDGTIDTGKTLGQTGTMSFTEPTDIIEKYLYGQNGFWYKITFSAALDAEVEVSGITFDSSFQDIANVWNGELAFAIEALVEGTTQWSTFGSGAVDVDALASGKKIVFSSFDPIVGVYIDVGATPNATGTAITSLKYSDGSGFTTVGTITDGTDGLSNSGFITFGRQPAAMPIQFESSQYYSYWYELILDTELSADMVVSIQTIPYFDVTELGNSRCNEIWKERACYSFGQYSEYLYLAESNNPLGLNGSDYGILKAGDGRSNDIVAMRKFHNELMVWQEETGVEGGCVTLFEGYSPTTFGKLLLSSKIGTFNNKTVEIIDGVMTSTATEEKVKTLAFFLSRYGVCVSDGRTISIISDDIRNYFDTLEPECIRRGYEDQMWLKHDSAYNVIRMGLVSGTSATVPNVFPVFDLNDKTWSFDVIAQELSCMTEVEAASGDVIVLQIGGGTDDGFIYQLNYGINDVDTAVNSYVTLELSGEGEYINLNEFVLRCKTQTSGGVTMTLYANEISQSTLTLSMIAEVTNQTIRRHRENINVTDQHISIKLQNNTASVDMFLYDLGLGVDIWDRR